MPRRPDAGSDRTEKLQRDSPAEIHSASLSGPDKLAVFVQAAPRAIGLKISQACRGTAGVHAVLGEGGGAWGGC